MIEIDLFWLYQAGSYKALAIPMNKRNYNLMNRLIHRQYLFWIILSFCLIQNSYAQMPPGVQSYKAHDITAVTSAMVNLYLTPDTAARTKDYLKKGDVFEVLAVKDASWIKIAYLNPEFGTIERWMAVADNNPMSDKNIIAGYQQALDTTIQLTGGLYKDMFSLSLTNSAQGVLHLKDADLAIMYISLESNKYIVQPLFSINDDLTLLPGESYRISDNLVHLDTLTGAYWLDLTGGNIAFSPAGMTGEWTVVPVLTRAGWPRPLYGRPDTISMDLQH